jgi:hypothetical protein
MDPEEEFIQNATTMLHYSRTELKQFLAWTTPNTTHHQQATQMLAQLDQLAVGMKKLLHTYKKR